MEMKQDLTSLLRQSSSEQLGMQDRLFGRVVAQAAGVGPSDDGRHSLKLTRLLTRLSVSPMLTT